MLLAGKTIGTRSIYLQKAPSAAPIANRNNVPDQILVGDNILSQLNTEMRFSGAASKSKRSMGRVWQSSSAGKTQTNDLCHLVNPRESCYYCHTEFALELLLHDLVC